MKAIQHQVKLLIQTESSNCVQTAASQLISFFGKKVSPDAIELAIPVRVNDQGEPLGTLLPDIAAWAMQTQDLAATVHVFDAQLIDRSWVGLSQDKVAANLKELQKRGVSTALTPYAQMLIESYNIFLESGGKLDITYCTTELICKLLQEAPVMAILNFNYLYNYPRSLYDKKAKTYKPDMVDGKVIGHAVVITGYKDGFFTINDPDYEKGGQNQIERDVLIGAICAQQINSTNFLLSLSKLPR